MDKDSKTRQQLLLEIEELKTSLDVSQQRLQEANERLQAGTIEHERTEQVLEDRLKFETLLAELSAHFVNLPHDRIDSEIEKAMSRICALLAIDRATLWQVSEGDPRMLLLTNINQPQDIPPPPERMNARDFFPWASQKIMNGETVIIQKMDRPPARSKP